MHQRWDIHIGLVVFTARLENPSEQVNEGLGVGEEDTGDGSEGVGVGFEDPQFPHVFGQRVCPIK